MFKAAFQSAKKQERYQLMHHLKMSALLVNGHICLSDFFLVYVYIHLRLYHDNIYILMCHNNIKKLKHFFLWVDFYLSFFCHSDVPL